MPHEHCSSAPFVSITAPLGEVTVNGLLEVLYLYFWFFTLLSMFRSPSVCWKFENFPTEYKF
jgi:hypothetical protein